MKQFHFQRRGRKLVFLTFFLTSFFTVPKITQAQSPYWNTGTNMAHTASVSDYEYATSADAATDVETINCDLYYDMSSTGGPAGYLRAIVWDEQDSFGDWHVYIDFIEDTYGEAPYGGYDLGVDKRHPDVAILDISSNTDEVTVGIVYEDHSGGTVHVVYEEFEMHNVFSAGSPDPQPGPGAGPSITAITLNANNNNNAYNPHIDALPSDVTFFGTGLNQNYIPLEKFVVTWTEIDGDPEIWLQAGVAGTGPVGNEELVYSDATESDVAAQLIDGTDDIAYVTYIDDNGFLIMEEFDVSTPATITSNGSTTLENTYSVVSYPRIDAINVHDPANGTDMKWVATAAVDVSSQQVISVYDDQNGATSFSGSAPYSSVSAEGFIPAIAAGPGPDDYNGNTTFFGNQYYFHAGIIDANEFIEATDYEIQSTYSFGDYRDINKNSLPSLLLGDDPPFGIATASNCGKGMLAAWFTYNTTDNEYRIASKMIDGNTFAFKPEKPTSIVAARQLKSFDAYPNPAITEVSVGGINAEATYIATDITGKQVMKGKVNPQDNTINISHLPNGVYIFNFNENGIITPLKLVKQ